jgi:deoxyribodipyrimidine photo-lyase
MEERVRRLKEGSARKGGRHVLYWMRWNRRAEANHALTFAAGTANRLGLPLVVFESEDLGSERQRAFARAGAAGNARAVRKLGIGYVWGSRAELGRWVSDGAAVVTDDWPETLDPLPEFDCEAYAVDSSCIVPGSAIAERAYAARSIRPKIGRVLERYLTAAPRARVAVKWTWAASEVPLGAGGRAEGLRVLRRFLKERLHRYASEKNEPTAHATSELSAYLHFGHVSSLEVALAVRAYAAEHRLMADEFLEELIMRRELAFNFARTATRVDSLAELPAWAQATLEKHRGDRRDPVYTRAQFEEAATYDSLWNATQKELRVRGRIHGYYRMYWGKKILEWSATPEDALTTMIELHDRYAVDARDPNTYTNILWCFGLHDRPWPERAVYGTVRSMGRAGMERKTDVAGYVAEVEAL